MQDLEFPNRKTSQEQNSWTGLHASSISLALAKISSEHQGPCLVIAANEDKAQNLLEEHLFFQHFFHAKNQHRQSHFFSQRTTITKPQQFEDRLHSTERLSSLHACLNHEKALVFSTGSAIKQALIPPDDFFDHCGEIQVGDRYERDDILLQLVSAGYNKAERVEEPGDVAIRGGIIDVFCPSEDSPFRIEFFDDEVESIRAFDPLKQTSKQNIDKITWQPCKEILYKESDIKSIQSRIKQFCDDRGMAPKHRLEITQAVKDRRILPAFNRLLALVLPERMQPF